MVEKELEGISGIFITKHQMSNMNLERIVVSGAAIMAILKVTELSQEAQEEAVMNLVERTEEWLSIEPEDQIEKIKAVLTQESVIEFLKVKQALRPECDMVQTGIDAEGSIVIEAYYTQMNREERRATKKKTSPKERKEMSTALNILSGNDNLIDLAREKLKRLEEEKKKGFRPVVTPKKKK